MLTSPVPAARAAVATGAWVESKHDMYLIHTWKCRSSSFIFTHLPEDEKRKKRKANLVPGAVHARTQQTIQIRGTGVCLARKTPCEQGLPHCTYVLQAEQRLPSATEEKAKRSFPMERDPLPSTTLRVIRSARSGVGQRSFRSFLCPIPKVTPRSSLGDVGEARWPLPHRWTDTSSTLPDAAHDSRNQGRVVSLSGLSLLSACVRMQSAATAG